MTDIHSVLVVFDYYKNDQYCVIKKILLSTNKSGIRWYNDITNFTKKPLLFLALKLREEWVGGNNIESHIFSTEINNTYILEIFTLNEVNKSPHIISKEKLYEKLLQELLQDF